MHERIAAAPPRRELPPLIVSFDAKHPLPLEQVRPNKRHMSALRGREAAHQSVNGAPIEVFNFTEHIRRLTQDVAARFEPLAHIDVSRILFGFTQARNGRSHGLQARVTPLRYRDGQLTRLYRGVPFQVQRYFVEGREMLYVVAFCLPRFLDRSFEDKFVTLFHELWHISPSFDGDLRRHEGRYAVHTRSQRRYDEEMLAMARKYLRRDADPERYAFMRMSFAQILQKHRRIVGHRVPRPKLIPIR